MSNQILELRKDELSQRELIISDIQEKFYNGELYLSYSALSAFRKSPKHFIDYKIKAHEDTDSMLLGKAFHCLVLEPQKFEIEFAIAPNIDRRTKAGKEAYEQFLQTSQDKTVLSDTLYNTAIDMACAALSNKESKALLDGLEDKEQKVFFEKYGFKFMSVLDGNAKDYVIDLKQIPDATPQKVQREIISRGWWLQAGMYLEGIKEDKDYYIIAVDRQGNVSVHLLMKGLIEYGMTEFKRLCADFEDCLSTDSWNESFNYRSHNGIYPIDKPNYSF